MGDPGCCGGEDWTCDGLGAGGRGAEPSISDEGRGPASPGLYRVISLREMGIPTSKNVDKEVMEPGGDRVTKNSYSHGKQPEAPASAPRQTRESLIEIWE